MPETRWLVVALVACLGLAAYTSFKLHRMARIVDAPGISQRVVRKTVEHGERNDYCFFWTPDKVQSDCDFWERTRVGDTIEIVIVDDERYVKGASIYASDGNFVFDKVLLGIEIVGALACVVLLVIRRRQRV